MTRDEILALSPADLNAAVHQHVFGVEVLGLALCLPWHDSEGYHVDGPQTKGEPLPVYVGTCCCAVGTLWRGDVRVFGHLPSCLEVVPDYCGDGNQMLRLIETMREKGWMVDIRSDWDVDTTRTPWRREWWTVVMSSPREPGGPEVTAEGDTLPLACARATLLAQLGV
jgi:hypothetical protein